MKVKFICKECSSPCKLTVKSGYPPSVPMACPYRHTSNWKLKEEK